MKKKTQHAAVKVQLNEKYTQVNVMKAQKDQSEQKLNNLVGKKKLMQPDEFEREEQALDSEIKCFSKTINAIKMQIHSLKQDEKDLRL